jgi:hypothetical protein
MKKVAYISLFTLLGVLVSFLIHGVLEISVVHFLTTEFSTYNLGLSWSQWFAVHRWGSWLLLIIGIGVGLWQGVYWWEVLYEKGSGGSAN